MTILENPTAFIDDLLRRIADSIQLDETRRQRALQSYDALTDLLERGINGENLESYAQGSFRIGTTVKPWAAEEYDLDFVVEFVDRQPNYSIQKTLEQVYAAIAASKTYEHKVALKTRCVRVTYQNEFHVDVLPAIPDPSRGSSALLVPDRDLKSWTPSSPKGYALWFESVAKEHVILEMIKKALASEPIPNDPDLPQKAPLKVAAQLLKRRRDVMLSDQDWKPSSILLTTLLANNYAEQLSPFRSLLSAVSRLAKELSNQNPSDFRVPNPTNEEEDFTDKWENRSAAFCTLGDMVTKFTRELESIEAVSGMESVSATLGSMFGEAVTKRAFGEQAEYVRKSKNTGELRLRYGADINTRVRPNTFYGE